MSYIVTPDTKETVLIATLDTAASHIDASVQSNSNTRVFNRAKQIIAREDSSVDFDVQHFVNLFPVPSTLTGYVTQIDADEFLAVATLQLFISAFGSKDGIGLFEGVLRYQRLEDRARDAAIKSATMFEFWGTLCNDMQVGSVSGYYDDAVANLMEIPTALAFRVLGVIKDLSAAIIPIARIWSKEAANNSAQFVTAKPRAITLEASSYIVTDVPAVSANAIRSSMVRKSGMLYMLNALDLQLDDMKAGAAAMLYNGGNLNKPSPDDTFALTRKIRESYPLLGLIGGSTHSFILGISNLMVSSWLVCKENNRILERYGAQSDISAFELLDTSTMTRHANQQVEGSPMPFGFESLVQGAQLLVKFGFRPYATELEMGALYSALWYFENHDATLFGQAARGFGQVTLEYRKAAENANALLDKYSAYLTTNKDALRAGLVDGKLTTHADLF